MYKYHSLVYVGVDDDLISGTNVGCQVDLMSFVSMIYYSYGLPPPFQDGKKSLVRKKT